MLFLGGSYFFFISPQLSTNFQSVSCLALGKKQSDDSLDQQPGQEIDVRDEMPSRLVTKDCNFRNGSVTAAEGAGVHQSSTLRVSTATLPVLTLPLSPPCSPRAFGTSLWL